MRRATQQLQPIKCARSCSSSALPTTSKRVSSSWDNSGMALLQISEPGQAPDPHQRRIAVGIDLGTTHSLVAAVRSGVAECLPDAQGRVLLPSIVRYLDGGGRQIGHPAIET